VHHQVQLGASLRVCSGVYSRTFSEEYFGVSEELSWEHVVTLTGSVPSSAIRRVLESMLGNVLGNILGGVLHSILGGVLDSVL